MIVVKATKDTEAGNVGEEKMFAAMTTYHEELTKSGSASRCFRVATNVKGLAN